MRKLKYIFITGLILSLGICSTIFASEDTKLEMLSNSSDYEEVLTIEEVLLEKFQGILADKHEMKPEDFCYEKAVKVYHDQGILDVSSTSELEDFMDNAEYSWWIPVYVGGDTLIAIVDKMRFFSEDELNAMTEDERAYYIERIGKWYSGSILEAENRTLDYETNLKNSLVKAELNGTNEDRYILINGIRGIQYPVFIGMDDTKLKYVIPAEAATDNVFNAENDNNKTTRTVKSPDRTIFSIYSFEDVRQAINKNDIPSGIGAGGIKELARLIPINEKKEISSNSPINSIPPWIYIGGIVLVVSLITLLTMQYRKRQKSS